MSRQPILVTGAHRSGTTWVGKTLARDPSVRYVHEPFNVTSSNPLFGLQLDTWFLHLPGSKQEELIARKFRYLLNPIAYAAKKSKVHGVGLHTPRILVRELVRELRQPTRLLVKDPLALLSAEWLHKRFDFQVAVTIRNPLGFVGSVKKAGWDFDFDHLRRQEGLLEGRLKPFADDIRAMCREGETSDFIDRACLLWNILHFLILDYRDKYPDWYFVRHEDLARQPREAFEKLYRFLNLEYTQEVRAFVADHTSGGNPAESDSVNFGPRDARQVLRTWKDRLTAEETGRVREATREVASAFYETQ